VADHEHVLAVRMRGGDGLDGLDHARLHAIEGLAIGRATADGIAHPAAVGIAGQRPDLLHRAPLPVPERQLAQVIHEGERQAVLGHHDLRCQPGALERARVDVGDRAAAEPGAQGDGLPPAEIRQRDVLRALEAAHGIGERLPVAGEPEGPHRAAAAQASAAARSRASVSALPRMLMTSKIGGLAVRPVSAIRVSWARSTSLQPSSAARPR